MPFHPQATLCGGGEDKGPIDPRATVEFVAVLDAEAAKVGKSVR